MNKQRLVEEARVAIETMGINERAKYATSPRWIPYSAAREILGDMQYFLEAPRDIRPYGMLITGYSDNGKTALLTKFVEENQTERFTDRINKRIVYVNCTGYPSADAVIKRILRTIHYPFKESSNLAGTGVDIINAMFQRLETELLVVDEIHSSLGGGTQQLKIILNVLKDICNVTKIPLYLAGTTDAVNVVKSDAEVFSRFPIYELPLWYPDDELRAFLVRLEATLPLKKESRLWECAETIWDISGGVIGNIVKVIKFAAEDAILSGQEMIKRDDLHRYLRRISKPSDFVTR